MWLFIRMGTIYDWVSNISPEPELKVVNIVALGIDETEGVQRSDTIVLIHIDTINQTLKAISIPRDTYLEIPNYGYTKINHAYAYGKEALLLETISRFFHIPVNYFVKIKLEGVEHIVDRLDGVELNVDKNMHYTDRAGNLYIDLKKGEQVLKGKELLGYLRFRHDALGDISRIQRQQEFLNAIAEKIINSGNIFTSISIIKQLSPYIETNLSLKEQLQLGVQINKIYQQQKIEILTLKGVPQMINGVSYWIADPKVVEEITNTFKTDAIKMEPEPILMNDSKTSKSIKVTVLNGSGVVGQALKAAEYLKDKGLNVMEIGYAKSFDYPKTLVIANGLTKKELKEIKKNININSHQFVNFQKKQNKKNITVIVGKDWEQIRLNN